MKRFGLALWMLLWALMPAHTQSSVFVPATMQSLPITISTATTTKLIDGISGKLIYITNINIIAGGAGAIQFIAGTGATCGTGTVTLTGNYVLTAQQGFVLGVGNGTVIVIPAGLNFCAVTDSAVGMPGSVAYAIF